jgi:hypothetical protein
MRIVIMLAVAFAFIESVRGQDFENLNFESAQNLPANPGLVSVANALPDWAAFAGPNVLSSIYYISNNSQNGSSPVELDAGSSALSGNNLSVGVESGGEISQTGMVPGNAESLQFESSSYVDLYVTLGGQILSYSALSQGPDYTVYGANIPANMDGQKETLTFYINGPGGSLLDDIVFSTSVPEPSECALLGFGAILFGLFRRRPPGHSCLRHDPKTARP